MQEAASDRWQRIDELFGQALNLDAKDRESFLKEACGADEGLRDEILDLLTTEAAARRFLGDEASEIAASALAEALSEESALRPNSMATDRSGERIGPWRLVRQLGRGGMAGVYLGERADGGFEQKVAIKFVRPGLHTEDFARRFVAERQILSSLHHSNIASLIGGGTTEAGLPYLVLEYVDGVPITEFCDRHGLSVAERLRLFCDVARAVQYAHANLVAHRDIKPGNILVTANRQVKLLDFGIAKLLDPEIGTTALALTRTGFRPLTPEYASPEQVRGESITTASDVYQLGLLLYRLLTGERPYDIRGSDGALEEAITETRPTPPSVAARRLAARAASRKATTPERLSRRLRGDLDVIVLKALRKEPSARYGSASDMADDVQRHLQGRPIFARRESRVYRIRKFLRRRAWVAPVAAGAAAFLGYHFATLVRHGHQLEAERNVARDVQQAFVGFFTAPDSTEGPGLGEGRRDLSVREAILEGVDRVREDLADRPAARAELFGAMAAVLTDLDEIGEARELAEEALRLEEELYGGESREVHETLAMVGNVMSDPDSARVLQRRHLALSQALYGDRHPVVAASLQALGQTETRDGNLEAAASLFDEAVELLRERRTADSLHPRRLAWALGSLAETYIALGRTLDAVAASREAYVLMRGAYGERHSEAAIHGVKLAAALGSAGESEEARRLYEANLPVIDEELGSSHTTALSSRGNYALLLLLLDDYEAAEAVQRQLLANYRARYGDGSPSVGAALQNLATNLKEQGRHAEAEPLLDEAFRAFLGTRGEGHYQTALPLLTLAEIRLVRGDWVGAENAARRAARILRATLPTGHVATAVAECRLGRSLAAQGELIEGRRLLEDAAGVLDDGERAGVAPYREECLTALAALEPAATPH